MSASCCDIENMNSNFSSSYWNASKGLNNMLNFNSRSHIIPFLCVLCALCVCTAADSDWLPESTIDALGKSLDEKDEHRAEAIARYASGILLGVHEGFSDFEKSIDADPSNADLALRLANDYVREGKISRALETLQRSAEASPPGITQASLLLAIANIQYTYLDNADKALELIKRAEALAPDDFVAADLAIRIYRATGRNAEIRTLLTRLEKSKSENPDFWIDLAWAHLSADTPKSRVLPFVVRAEKFAKKSPQSTQNSEALVRVGALYSRLERPAEAMQAYEAAYKQAPNIDHLREYLVASYIEAQRDKDAVPLLKEIIALNPFDIRAYESLAEISAKLGDTETAISASRQAFILDSENIGRHIVHASYLLGARKLDEAEKFLAEASKTFPDAPIFTYFLGVVCTGRERYEEALELFAKADTPALRMLPPAMLSEFYFAYGATSEIAGRHDDAVIFLKRAIAQDTGRATDARNHLAYMWAERGENLDEAETLIRRALEDEPTNAAFLDTLGWIQYQQGKYKASLETLRKALKHLYMPNAVVLDHIGDTSHKLGLHKRALEYWKKSLEIDPTSEPVKKKILDATKK